jgi:hypothetical protein
MIREYHCFNIRWIGNPGEVETLPTEWVVSISVLEEVLEGIADGLVREFGYGVDHFEYIQL